jgi:hypothetical protein
MFRAARDADYQALAEEARAVARSLPRKGDLPEERRAELVAAVGRLQKRHGEIAAIDFFHARSRETVDGLFRELEQKLAARAPPESRSAAGPSERPRGATWVTRTGIHVDRMASAWLIRRFIDPDARFKFVEAKGYAPAAGELRFDMFDAEFTHEGDLCTFEVLLDRWGAGDAGLRRIADMVHDVDLRDAKFGREETDGFTALVTGICLQHRDDAARLEAGAAMLDALHRSFRQRGRA